jgi:hypothetical protein
MPIYRHPSDETLALLPWTSTVDEIRQVAEAVAGHALNQRQAFKPHFTFPGNFI